MDEMMQLDTLHAEARRLLRWREQLLRQRYGLTAPQFAVIKAVAFTDGMEMRALAERLACTPGNITGIVDRLERDGWLIRERSHRDRRAIVVRLAPGMVARVNEIIHAVAELETQLSGRLNEVTARLQGYASVTSAGVSAGV